MGEGHMVNQRDDVCAMPRCLRPVAMICWIPLSAPVDDPRKRMVGLCEHHCQLEPDHPALGRLHRRILAGERGELGRKRGPLGLKT